MMTSLAFVHFMCVTPINAFVAIHVLSAPIVGRQGTPPLHGGTATSRPGQLSMEATVISFEVGLPAWTGSLDALGSIAEISW